MTLAVWYYSYVFISMLFVFGRVITLDERLFIKREDIKRSYSIFCASFLLWSLVIFFVGILKINVLERNLLFLCEFCRIVTFLSGAELCASITDRIVTKKRLLYSISSYMLYGGLVVLFAKLTLDKARIDRGVFGDFLAVDSNIALLLYIVFYVTIVFEYAIYTYMHYFTSNNMREYYISKKFVLIVGVISIALIIESGAYILFRTFVPVMHLAMLFCVKQYKKLIEYKRSIEYHEEDYSRILTPSHTNTRPAFVCDDEGKIIFENTRAFVMSQMYKDSYVGKYLTDVFDISDYDKERLKEPRITQSFDVYCKYEKEHREMVLIIKHNIDKFNSIFSTEVEVGYADVQSDVITADENQTEGLPADNSMPVIPYEETKGIRTEQLILQLESQKRLYEKNNKVLFELGIKGINKSAAVLKLIMLQDLCDRIEEELKLGEWESLSPLMIQLDRQYESLLLIK